MYSYKKSIVRYSEHPGHNIMSYVARFLSSIQFIILTFVVQGAGSRLVTLANDLLQSSLDRLCVSYATHGNYSYTVALSEVSRLQLTVGLVVFT